ncbi:MAG: hypothetical protein ABS916_03580 [Carnobacterium sp.]|uniref:hypothetical protein n=1 Tax=Carnobacterium sp. TaxID=48221 RepID=UPI0033151F09
MNVNINLGSVWEMLSAIGTIGAVIVSLFLAFRESKPDLKVRVSIESFFHRYYNLVLIKNPTDVFTIVRFGYYGYFRKNYYNADLVNDVEVLNEEDSAVNKRIPLVISSEYILKLVLLPEYTTKLIGKKIRFFVEDIDGKIYKSNKIKIQKLNTKQR